MKTHKQSLRIPSARPTRSAWWWLVGLALAVLLVNPTRTFAAFGLTQGSNYYQVDTGAGLVFKVRTDNPSSTTSPGDIMSLVYNGVEYQDQTRGSQLNSGFDWIYNYTNTVNLFADVYGTNYIKITVICGDTNNPSLGLLTHYYIVRNGYPYIYMATYFNKEPDAQGLCRYIVRSTYNLVPHGPPPSDLNGNTGAIESSDIYGMADGTTRSKHYSNHRLIDWSYTGATNSSIGIWMVRESGEGSSGGPFYRCLINQGDGTNSDQEVYEISNYGEAQTEAYRLNILDGPYTLVFTDGSAPAVPLDYSWLQTAGLNLVGFVPDANRGAVTGTASGIPSGFQAVVGFANTNAQYWAIVDTSGSYTTPLMIPGTYTATLYKQELGVASASVTVTANTTNILNLVSTESTPSYVFKIGDWDGTPSGFLNADKMTYMHPSDVRMSNWGPGSNVFNVGTDPISIFPAVTMRGTNTHCYINFSLTSAQITNMTLRIGATTAYDGGRPDVHINGHDLSFPAAPSEPKTRAWTIGTYRGNNLLWTWSVPAADLIVGQNTFDLTPVSGTADSSAWLSAGWVYDAVELDGPAAAPQLPATPTGLTATAGNNQVALSWNASTEATSYNVKRATVSGGPYTTIANVTTTTYTDITAVNGTTYYYVVSARNSVGESADSMEVSATPQAPPPPAPTGLTATAGNAQVALAWNTSSGATGYNVKRALTSGGPYTTIASGVTATSYTDATALNGTTYYYVVSAVNASGESANSSEVSATPAAPPLAPTVLTATAQRQAGKIKLTWTQSVSPGITNNKVYRSTVNGGPYTLVTTLAATTTYTDGGLTSGTTYYYVVTAVNSGGESPYSNQASATSK